MRMLEEIDLAMFSNHTCSSSHCYFLIGTLTLCDRRPLSA